MRGQHFDYLDGWRGLAIGFLLVGHFFPVAGINLGTFGVNLFFVLSGWLMTRLLFVQDTPINTFYKRRISRIFPAHFVFIGSVVGGYLVTQHDVAWPEVVAAALFVNNYFSGELGRAVMPFGHIWSLAVEEHSYILLSIIAVAARRKWVDPTLAIGFCCAVFALAGAWYWTQYSGAQLDFGKWIHTEVSAFGIFASAFFMLLFRKTGVPKLPAFLYVALALCALAMHWWSVANPLRTILGVGTLALLVNLLIQAPRPVTSMLSFGPLCSLGTWSFSIYIWQQPFYLASRRGDMPVWVALPLALTAGLISYYVIERPVRRYLNRAWAR
jgi:peptidoglycan/LPS O-acetylase OafA/YrhL